MDDLPLARTTMSHALQQETNLIIYVEGLTSGFGGELIVQRSFTDEFPPSFIVLENPDNSGINPDASPTNVPTVVAYAFFNQAPLDAITLVDASGRKNVEVVNVQPEPVQDGGSQDGGSSGGPKFECEWSAVHDFMPPRPARLRVNGTCIMPTPGYKLTLTRAEPQGINPNILLLNLEVETPGGIVPQVLTPTPVAYEEVTDHHYLQVTILPDGATVDVQEVH
jgi:hypothetical protein